MAERERIAAVTDDGETICAHFGRATHYAILEVEDGEIVERTLVEKLGHHQFGGGGPHRHEGHSSDHTHQGEDHQHGFGPHAGEKHQRMIEPLKGCKVLLSGGMGRGAHIALESAGIRPVLTDIQRIEEAVKAHVEGNLISLTDRLH